MKAIILMTRPHETAVLAMDNDSTWTLTGDSYVTAFNGAISNVVTNGYTLYVNGVAVV